MNTPADFSTTALVINSEGMGQGDEALRHRLLASYLQTLSERGTPPQAILLYASGVRMAIATSPCREVLTLLGEAGSQIVICRTCLDHYGLLTHVPEAEIGNMLMIVEAQARAHKVIAL